MIFISVASAGSVPCGGRKMSPLTSTVVQFTFYFFEFQAISLVISSELSNEVVEIVEDKTELSTIHVDCFSDSQEWTLHNFVELSPLDISAQYTRVKQTYPGLVVTCCVTRRSGFFAWNVLVIVVSIDFFEL